MRQQTNGRGVGWVVRVGVALAWASAIGATPTARAADGAAAAQASAAMKVGFVDLARVFDGYARTKSSDAVLERQGKQKETELETRLGELRKLRQTLELLSADAREAKAREIEEKAEELQRFRNNTARELRRERDKVAKEIFSDIEAVLKEYAESHGYALIIDSRSLLFGQSAHDVTDELLTALNKRAGTPPAPQRSGSGGAVR